MTFLQLQFNGKLIVKFLPFDVLVNLFPRHSYVHIAHLFTGTLDKRRNQNIVKTNTLCVHSPAYRKIVFNI